MLSGDAVSCKCVCVCVCDLCACVCVYRNLSSVNERTRQKMRDMQGLVDSLVSYIEQEDRPDDKVTSRVAVIRTHGFQRGLGMD